MQSFLYIRLLYSGDELNIRLVYYDYESENLGWLENGKGELWQGWITAKIDI